MAVDAHDLQLKLIRRAAGLELDLLPLQGLWTEARIPEYWIANPLDETITVLTLAEDAYAEHGVFRRGETATSALLAGFDVSLDVVFNAR